MGREKQRIPALSDSDVEKIGINTLNGEPMEVYEEALELPGNDAKRSVCENHFKDGVDADLLEDFWMGGCDFDKSLEEGVVRLKFSCLGCRALSKRCQLTITQYDTEGNELTSMRVDRVGS